MSASAWMHSFAERMSRPCAGDCGGPIGRSHLKAKLCYACWRKRHRVGTKKRQKVMTGTTLRQILDAVIRDPERRASVQASLEAGEQLRVFLCSCRTLYNGANRRLCDRCLAATDDTGGGS